MSEISRMWIIFHAGDRSRGTVHA